MIKREALVILGEGGKQRTHVVSARVLRTSRTTMFVGLRSHRKPRAEHQHPAEGFSTFRPHSTRKVTEAYLSHGAYPLQDSNENSRTRYIIEQP